MAANNRQTATGPAPGANASGVDVSGIQAAADKPTGVAELRPAAIFSHDMVLQRHQPIPLFGTGQPGRTVVATLTSDAEQMPIRTSSMSDTDSVTGMGTIGDDGGWLIFLPALEAGGPYTLTISDRADISLTYLNVMVGEVWIASGQSNIEFELRNDLHARSAMAGSSDSLLRFFNVPKSGFVEDDLITAEDSSSWRVCRPDSCGTMSAIAYHFAHRLRRDLASDVPVGIIDCYVGGTSVTAWMSERTLASHTAGRGYLERYHAQVDGKTDAEFHAETEDWQQRFDKWNADISTAQAAEPDITWDTLNARYGQCPWPPPVTPFSQYHVTGAFNAMVSRLAPFGARGVLWYQGEEDEQHHESYRDLLTLMIGEWRGLWKDRNLSFLIMQLPRWIDKSAYESGGDPMFWPYIRQAQVDVSNDIDGAHPVITFDTGEFNNIHPTDKRPVGERAAMVAEAHVYGMDVASDGPTVTEVSRDLGGLPAQDRPQKLRVRFAHARGLRFDRWSGWDDDAHRMAVTANTAGITPQMPASLPCDRMPAGLSGFEVAGIDDIYHPADAWIDGDSVIVESDAVTEPVSVRYGWYSWGPAPLFNGDGLPAAPFQSRV